MTQQSIFYSWQSWSDDATNHHFIQECLEQAIKEIRQDDSLHLDPVIDRDTKNKPGAVEIANTVFSKITEADVFVADVSLVPHIPEQRPTPNPNVLIELGFALSKLGDGKVVLVHNLATGRFEDLPFDIRGRSIEAYDLKPKAAVSNENEWQRIHDEQFTQLVGKLRHSISTILSAADPRINAFVNEMLRSLIRAIIFGSEVDDRPITPGCDVMRAELEGVAHDLRAMVCMDEARELEITTRLEEIADAIEQGIHFEPMTRGGHPEYVRLVKHSVEVATILKNDWLIRCPLNKSNLNEVHVRLYEIRRELESLVARLPELLDRSNGLQEIYETANRHGLDLCRFAQYGLEPIQSGITARLASIGRNLHLVGVTPYYDYGRRGHFKTLEDLPKFVAEFGELMDGLLEPR